MLPVVSRLRSAGRELSWLATACVLFWYLRVWQSSGQQVELFANFDALMYWMPLLREAAAQWRTLTVPLWNPYQAFGTPLLATQQVAALYPLNLLYLWLEPGPAWLCTVLLHHLVAGFGMYVFGRVLRLSSGAAIVGAASYAFSGVVIEKYLDLPDEFICVAWLPAMFACAEALLRAPRFGTMILFGFSWALHILGGDADTIARSGLLLGSYVALRLLSEYRRFPRRTASAAIASAGAAALALALSAMQWLPTAELVGRSVRSLGSLSAAQQVGFSADLSLFLANRRRGIPTPSIASTLPLLLAVCGFWTWRRRVPAWFFGLAAVIVAMVSLGPATPLFTVMRQLPTGTWFRAPVRVLNLWPLCVATLAAAAVDPLTAGRSTSSWRARAGAACAGLILAIQIVLAARTGTFGVWSELVAFSLVPVLLVGALVKMRKHGREIRHATSAVVLLFVCATPLMLFEPEILSPYRTSALYAPYAEIFAALRPYSPARVLSLLPVADGRSWAKLGTYFEVPVLNDFEPLTLDDFRTFSEGLLGDHQAVTGLRERLDVFTGDTVPPHSSYNAALLNLSGVRFVVADTSGEAAVPRWFADLRLVPWRRWGSVVVYENIEALPRAFFVGAAEAREAGTECVRALERNDVNGHKGLLLDALSPTATVGQGAGRSAVDVRRYEPAGVQLGVTTGEAGYVVLTDAFYPGWTAQVDGIAAPIRRADCFFRAVPVPAGTHTVVFSYAPRSFRLGCLITTLALALAGGGLLMRRFRYAT